MKNYISKQDIRSNADWSEEEQKEGKDLITEFGSMFVLDDMDKGNIPIVKHTIKLTDLLDESGTAEYKEELLFSHDKLSLASILRPLHQVTEEMLV